MKDLIVTAMTVMLFAACGKSVEEKAVVALEQNIEVYNRAIEGIKSANSEEEVAVVVENTAHSIDSLRETEEWEAYQSIIFGEDSINSEEIFSMQDTMREAALEFSELLSEKVVSFIK
ncbi:MAG: hypothetical protein IKY37_06525 [Bacteroidaceae bacterium]|nr:hypothetical protein [Bacteroidaceae bacterium]